ncbi:hypothetical protein EDB85DRAFT_1889705 [Lactarius pseudohatsudake]|nr:hypothetical protein EDB85DRAFT_1889705 [Lactarius pseudohatsudake]
MGRAGPPLPPGPSLPPNIRLLRGRRTRRPPLPCPRRPVRAERVRMRARRPGPSLPAHGGQRAHPSPLRLRRRLPSPTRPAPPAYARGGTVRPPLRAGHAKPNPTCPALPAYARGRTARPAPPRPRTQGEGRCAHPAARATPAQPPAHARGRVGASTPSARATPARRLRTPPRPRSLGDARGSVRPAQPPPRGVCYPSPPGLHTPGPRRCACKGEGRTHAKGVHGTRGDATRARAASGVARRVCGRGGAGRNPGGGAAHERKGRHIGARVRKGESDGEGVVNEAKRSRGEAARANGGHPPRQ